MKKFLTIMAVLTAAATPVLAQSSTNRGAVVKDRTQIEQSVSTNGYPNYNSSFDDLHAGGGF
jgi:hypothetical protein